MIKRTILNRLNDDMMTAEIIRELKAINDIRIIRSSQILTRAKWIKVEIFQAFTLEV